jgi:transposase-like protein
MNSNDSTKNKRRYTPEEKQSVLDFIAERKTQNKRGAQKEAAERFGISTVTISSWMKASKAKRGTKNTTAPKTQPLAAAQPADLRRLAAVLEEIADLEAQTAKLDALRAEAEELKNRLTAKQA